MVWGIDILKDYFSAFEDQYVLIDGAAGDLLCDDAGAAFQTARDPDVELVGMTSKNNGIA